MEHPEYIYWASVLAIAWPCSLFSRCSGILAATWGVGQLAYAFHAPEPQTQIPIYLVAAALTYFNRRTRSCVVVASLYIPLAVFSAAWAGNVDPPDMWWAIFDVAMVQVLVAPATVGWVEVRETIKAFRERGTLHDTLNFLRRQVWS